MKDKVLPVNLLSIAIGVIVVLLLFNSFLLARTLGYTHLPGEMSKLDIAREGAHMAIELSEHLAKEAEVLDKKAVREVIAQYKYEVDRASTPDDVVTLISDYSSRVQEVISREQDAIRRETLLSIISKDQNLQNFKGKATLSFWRGEEGIGVDDPTGEMTGETLEQVLNHPQLAGASWSMIEFCVENGQVSAMTSRSILDRLRMLESDKENLEKNLKQLAVTAGYADLNGSGITVKMYDSDRGFNSVIDIVHDRDVRDVVNELFAAGAKGVSIGGQRLVATSSIRCAGPIILVNQIPIAVDPIVIEAVGDAEVLASSLELIKAELREFGIKIEVASSEEIALPTYAK
jgi:hypothetical protein